MFGLFYCKTEWLADIDVLESDIDIAEINNNNLDINKF